MSAWSPRKIISLLNFDLFVNFTIAHCSNIKVQLMLPKSIKFQKRKKNQQKGIIFHTVNKLKNVIKKKENDY